MKIAEKKLRQIIQKQLHEVRLKRPKQHKNVYVRRFKDDEHVKLSANSEEGFQEETATIVSFDEVSDTYIVILDKKYRSDDDDGLREVTSDQVRSLSN